MIGTPNSHTHPTGSSQRGTRHSQAHPPGRASRTL
jgi:hypothetical protein